MAIRSVDEIINLSDSSKNPEKLAFKDLVKHIDPRIRERAPRHTSLHFKIPGILWGQPVFDAGRVERMIVRHYKRIGFKCEKLDNREILIKWGQEEEEYEGTGTEQHDQGTEASTDSDDSDDDDNDDDDTHSSSDGSSVETTTSSDSSETTDSDRDDGNNAENNTKCVTVEQIPLSKRLSIVNNQMQRNM